MPLDRTNLNQGIEINLFFRDTHFKHIENMCPKHIVVNASISLKTVNGQSKANKAFKAAKRAAK